MIGDPLFLQSPLGVHSGSPSREKDAEQTLWPERFSGIKFKWGLQWTLPVTPVEHFGAGGRTMLWSSGMKCMYISVCGFFLQSANLCPGSCRLETERQDTPKFISSQTLLRKPHALSTNIESLQNKPLFLFWAFLLLFFFLFLPDDRFAPALTPGLPGHC